MINFCGACGHPLSLHFNDVTGVPRCLAGQCICANYNMHPTEQSKGFQTPQGEVHLGAVLKPDKPVA